MACILLWSSAVKAHDSQADRKMDVTRECISRIFPCQDPAGNQGMDRPGIRQVPGGSGEQGKMEETGSEIIYGVPATLAVKE